ncbi:MAG: DUF72 domain-containing protein [Candidatus Dormibacteria bacterium]
MGVRIGTSGWQYASWRGGFYPAGTPQRLWLEHYVDHFDVVEVNNTFYHLPAATTFEQWRGRRPCPVKWCMSDPLHPHQSGGESRYLLWFG